jgi:hypothetical protein
MTHFVIVCVFSRHNWHDISYLVTEDNLAAAYVKSLNYSILTLNYIKLKIKL